MTSLGFSSKDAASFWMVLASVLLHAGFLGMVIMASSWLWDYKKQHEETITPVIVVTEPAAGPVVAEKIEQASVEAPEPAIPESPMIEEPAAPLPEPVAASVEPRLIDHVATAPIPLVKRKRPPQVVEAPKEPEKEKPKSEKKPKEPKEDPKEILAKRMAEIQKQVADKYKARAGTNNAQNPGSGGNRPDGAQGDRELNQWIELVKRRVKAHWSIIGEAPRPDTEALIGIEIGENGAVVRFSVDKSSGDQLFDRSAMRAISQAAPFPPVPSEAKEKVRRHGGVALRFTPGDLR